MATELEYRSWTDCVGYALLRVHSFPQSLASAGYQPQYASLERSISTGEATCWKIFGVLATNIVEQYTAWIGFIGSTIITLVQGFPVFLNGNWATSDFVASYVGIPIFIVPIIGWKLLKRTKVSQDPCSRYQQT